MTRAKKTPLSPPVPSLDESEQEILSPLEGILRSSPLPLSPYLTWEEKRRWLAQIVRNTTGFHQGLEVDLADKFKALIEDTKLALLPEEESSPSSSGSAAGLSSLLQSLLDTTPPPHAQRFASLAPHDSSQTSFSATEDRGQLTFCLPE